jgi:hypothetical protein
MKELALATLVAAGGDDAPSAAPATPISPTDGRISDST